MTSFLRRAHKVLFHFGSSIIFVLLTLFSSAGAVADDMRTEKLTISSKSGLHVFNVEVADTSAARAKGLMYRRDMASDAGMLFDFGKEGQVHFWMKNTYLPLDMIFITKSGRVARIEKNATPLSEKVIPSGQPVQYVLEVLGGTSENLGIEAGDQAQSLAIEAGTAE